MSGPDQGRVAPVWPSPKTGGKAFVDLQNDVTVKDVALAAREGYVSVEHLKRYTTLGMATDQGKTANVTGLAVLADELGKVDPGCRHHDLPPALSAGQPRCPGGPCERGHLPAGPALRVP